MYWTKYVVGKGKRLWHMLQKGNNWLVPKKAPFACDCNENNPIYSKDGSTIYWPSVTSDRKYFFFCRLDRAKKGYQPYWVDAKIIEKFKLE